MAKGLSNADRQEMKLRALEIRARLAGDRKLSAAAQIQADAYEVIRRAQSPG